MFLSNRSETKYDPKGIECHLLSSSSLVGFRKVRGYESTQLKW